MGTAQRLLVDVMKGRRSLGAVLGLGADDIARIVQLARGHLSAGRTADALRLLEGACALEPRVASLHQLRGIALEAASRRGDAIGAYTAAVQLLADAPEQSRAVAYAMRGIARLREGDCAGAVADLALARPHLGASAGPLAGEVERFLVRSAAALEGSA
jgi:Flp pilus assembly protein TadD